MDDTDERTDRVRELLREAAKLHHRVYRIRDGADDDWALWYADWLVSLSELPELLGATPSRSELTYLLVHLDREYRAAPTDQPWEDAYARQILAHFSPTGPEGL